MARKPRPSVSDQLKGGFRSWRNGTAMNPFANQAHAKEVMYERLERERATHYAPPTRPDGYFSQDRGYGAADYFIGKNGDITSERPHVHVVHNPQEGRIIFTVTQADGSHTATEYLPIDASGNEVNAVEHRLRQQLR